jgi:hypothetical protein
VEPQACRRLTNAVGGDIACQQQDVVSDISVQGPAREQAIYPPIAMAPPNLEPFEAGDGGDPTSRLNVLPFKEIWAVDFEFGGKPGESPTPVCLVAWELRSGRKIRRWRDQFGVAPPYPTDLNVLFVAYYASAEIGCHLALGWPAPQRVLDLFTEFRNHTNGIPTVSGSGLLGALAHHGLDGIGTVEKDEMRDLVLRGGSWSDAERAAILEYCESDVAALVRLLPVMLPKIDLPRALMRGRYMAAVAKMEWNGVPIDTATIGQVKKRWLDIQDQLIADIDINYGGPRKIGTARQPPEFARV